MQMAMLLVEDEFAHDDPVGPSVQIAGVGREGYSARGSDDLSLQDLDWATLDGRAADAIDGVFSEKGSPSDRFELTEARRATIRQGNRLIPVILVRAGGRERAVGRSAGHWSADAEGLDSGDSPAVSTAHDVVPHAIFRDEGDFWTTAYSGRTRRVKAMKGFGLIAVLLRREGQTVSALELLAATGGESRFGCEIRVDPKTDGLTVVSNLGDAGEVLDERAVRDYQQRLSDLRRRLVDLEEELEEVTTLNDLGRRENVRDKIERVVHERDFLVRQLAEGGRARGCGRVGRGGRRVASHRERARQIVTKNIKAGVAKIGTTDASLAHHLRTHIKTGYICVYSPDPEYPVRWVL